MSKLSIIYCCISCARGALIYMIVLEARAKSFDRRGARHLIRMFDQENIKYKSATCLFLGARVHTKGWKMQPETICMMQARIRNTCAECTRLSRRTKRVPWFFLPGAHAMKGEEMHCDYLWCDLHFTYSNEFFIHIQMQVNEMHCKFCIMRDEQWNENKKTNCKLGWKKTKTKKHANVKNIVCR